LTGCHAFYQEPPGVLNCLHLLQYVYLYSLPGTFALWNFRSLLVQDIICDIPLYANDMYL